MSDIIMKVKMTPTQAGKMFARNMKLEKALSKALKAICLTRDYVGEKVLPPIEGWEWFDAGKLISDLIPNDEWSEQFRLRTEAGPCCESPGKDRCDQCQEVGPADPTNH